MARRSEVLSSIKYCPPRTVAHDGSLTATLLSQGDEGSYLKMEDSGRLSFAPGDADTGEAACELYKHFECVRKNAFTVPSAIADRFRVDYEGPLATITSCDNQRKIVAHPKTLTVDGIVSTILNILLLLDIPVRIYY